MTDRRFLRKGEPKETHGMSGTPTYRVWRGIQDRCLNTKSSLYRKYGARGISVCERWSCKDGFVNFLSDMGERPHGTSLDRVDGSLGYSKENCRWATHEIQNRNRNVVVLSDAAVMLVRYMRRRGSSLADVGHAFGLTESQVSAIALYRKWRFPTSPPAPQPGRYRFVRPQTFCVVCNKELTPAQVDARSRGRSRGGSGPFCGLSCMAISREARKRARQSNPANDEVAL